jgi:hypothetical protein
MKCDRWERGRGGARGQLDPTIEISRQRSSLTKSERGSGKTISREAESIEKEHRE